jgi:hypothetical protein
MANNNLDKEKDKGADEKKDKDSIEAIKNKIKQQNKALNKIIKSYKK